VFLLESVTHTFVTRVPLGPTPADGSTQAWGMAVHPDGTRLYVADAQYTANGSGAGGTLVVIDTATNSVRNVVPLGNIPTGLAMGPACLKDADCDDANPCTDDRCDLGRCAHAANTAPC